MDARAGAERAVEIPVAGNLDRVRFAREQRNDAIGQRNGMLSLEAELVVHVVERPDQLPGRLRRR
jgi:hypothetical protein